MITDDKVTIIPQMAKLMGLELSPKPKWMPKWAWKLKKRRKEENALIQWKPVHYEPSKEQVTIMIAQELRDFAESLLGYSHIDPEKSSIPRSNRNVNGNRWMQNFKHTPPKTKPMTKRQHRKVVRKSIRDTNKKLEEMGMGT